MKIQKKNVSGGGVSGGESGWGGVIGVDVNEELKLL